MNEIPLKSPVVRISGLTLHHGKTLALDDISLEIPPRKTVGMIGPDGVGKSSLLSLISGAHVIQEGTIEVLGGNIGERKFRESICSEIAYMPQGLGKNLYPTLSVEENLQFFARLFGHDFEQRRRRIDQLTAATGMKPFLDRLVGKLSGGMKQKLGLCCALIHDPELLILDEPTTGVDPLARSQFWDLIELVRESNSNMSVIVATAYMEEAERFELLIAMDGGKIISVGSPGELLERTGKDSLESAFIELMPEEKRVGYKPVEIIPMPETGEKEIAIQAVGLTKRFGTFTAVDHVDFTIPKGEIFGFLGSNGCGKTTTMKMLTGLLPASEGTAELFRHEVDAGDLETRRRLGYMSQAFSLYEELTIEQNLILHARLFEIPGAEIPERIRRVADRFGLTKNFESLPRDLPLGVKQRLSLAVAVVHNPDVLILDEPTSGVDPIARDDFWRLIIELSREDHVTIFITTHFMNEAQRCDRISLMHAGKSLALGTPEELIRQRNAQSLDEAFIGYLLDAGAGEGDGEKNDSESMRNAVENDGETTEKEKASRKVFSWNRLHSAAWRERLELQRDPIRLTLAILGAAILMIVMGYGITMDVENLRFAVLDRDDTGLSRDYTMNIAGSRYFIEQPPIRDYEELDRRMRSGDISLAIEIPSGFSRNVQHEKPAEIAIWLDGAMPQRAETIRGYVLGMHALWMTNNAVVNIGITANEPMKIETRYRYNPDVKSLPAMVPAVIPLLLIMISAILSGLSVVREKELGSIINLYVTPMTRTEFMLGKQIPYIVLAMLSFTLLVGMAVFIFNVPIKGSVFALFLGGLLYCTISTRMGLLFSALTRSQIAVIFLAMIGTMLPAMQFSGLLNPVSSLEGAGKVIGEIYPTTHMLIVSRGVFNKALQFGDLLVPLAAMAVSVPVIAGLSIFFLKKQEK